VESGKAKYRIRNKTGKYFLFLFDCAGRNAASDTFAKTQPCIY